MKEKENLTDAGNPAYLFQTIGSDILCAIVNNQIDAVRLAREELAARGLDHSGKWVGFEKAEKIAKIEAFQFNLISEVNDLWEGGAK